MTMLTSDFLMGVVVGLCIAALFGWFWSIYRNWVRARDAFRKPQVVIHTTSKTPEQVGKEADAASLKIWLIRLVILGLLWLIVELFVPSAAQLVRRIVRESWLLFRG